MINCFHTPSSAVGQYFAGVGKHEAKLGYEFALMEEVSAEMKIFCRARTRGPGVVAMGAVGAGDGEREDAAIPIR